MSIAQSKITAQGQISVPASVRRKLAIGPGSVLEWSEQGDEVVVRRVGKQSCEAVHRALFGHKARKESPNHPEVTAKEGVRAYMRKKHARD